MKIITKSTEWLATNGMLAAFGSLVVALLAQCGGH